MIALLAMPAGGNYSPKMADVWVAPRTLDAESRGRVRTFGQVEEGGESHFSETQALKLLTCYTPHEGRGITCTHI